MKLTRHNVTLTTDAAGAATGYTPLVSGRVLEIVYTKDGTTPFADGIDFVVSSDLSGKTIFSGVDINATAAYMPRIVTQGAAKADLTGVEAWIVVDERIKIVVAQGGDTKTGVVSIIVGQ